ncbi:hypothetical protein PISL3812_04188 [Talaromyces islandicus]|uniref:Uncharacterized protein n=1 Tax=Talaromyces islandicus TaxID=28573 RepID=A0A0U1LWX4_TALIS|nr:hypothetical protein PISL3812_04188 [Talaromyces islandicus]
MYSCANYPRGCRGRCNTQGGKCNDCTVLNLRRPNNSFSPFVPTRDLRRPVRSVFAPQEASDKTHEI